MSWWLIALLVWPVIGLGVAYLFGRIVREAEAPTDAGRLASPVILYLRRNKRPKPSVRVRATPHTRSRREAGRQRAH